MNANAKILLTTSRNPTPKIRSFCNDIARVIPNIVRVNRGKMSTNDLAEKALEINADRAVVVDRWERGLCKIEFFKVSSEGLSSVPPTLFVADVRLQRELEPSRPKLVRSSTVAHTTSNAVQLTDSLAEFFNISKTLEKEDRSVSQVAMRVSQNTNGNVQITFVQLLQHVEIGPRIVLGRIEWERTK